MDRSIAAALTLITILEKERHDAENEAKRKRLWSRDWIERRNAGSHTTTTLHKELRYEYPASFTNFTRMDPDVFDVLLSGIEPSMSKSDTNMRQAIPARDRLAITLRFVATGDSYQDLAYSTRVAPNTISLIVPETLQAIISVFEDTYIKCPSSKEEWELVHEGFYTRWQFPHCVGAMDGKHINFRPLRKHGSHFRNYKGRESIVLLGLVDSEYKFLYIDIGKNGRTHDATVFKESSLYANLISGNLNLPTPSPLPGNSYPVPYVIVADNAFPLKDNILKPYPERNLSHEQRIFNYRLSRARRIVENAFVMLANRFGILLTTMRLSVEKVQLVTNACCVLHNFILHHKPSKYILPPEKLDKLPQLRSVPNQRGNHAITKSQQNRNIFCHYFNTIGSVPWQEQSVERGWY